MPPTAAPAAPPAPAPAAPPEAPPLALLLAEDELLSCAEMGKPTNAVIAKLANSFFHYCSPFAKVQFWYFIKFSINQQRTSAKLFKQLLW